MNDQNHHVSESENIRASLHTFPLGKQPSSDSLALLVQDSGVILHNLLSRF